MLTKKTEKEISIRKKTIRAADQLLKSKCAFLSKQNAELITESNKLTCELDTAKHYNTALLSDIENSDGDIKKVEADHKELVAGLNDKIREYRIENSDLMDKLNSKRVGVEIEHVVKTDRVLEKLSTRNVKTKVCTNKNSVEWKVRSSILKLISDTWRSKMMTTEQLAE